MAANVNFEAKTTWVQDEIVYPADANRWEKGIKDCADLVNDHNARIPVVETELPKKVNKAGDTMTGPLHVPTPSSDTRDASVPTTGWVQDKMDGKAATDLSNVSASGQKRAGAWALPDYSAGVSMGSGVQKAPADGWVSAYVTGPNNGIARGIQVGTSSSPNLEISRVGGYGLNTIDTKILFPIKKNWYYGPTGGCNVESATFFPL